MKPEFSCFQCDVKNENYKICDDDSIAMLSRVHNDEIIIRDYEQFSFIETVENNKDDAETIIDFSFSRNFVRKQIITFHYWRENS